MNSLPLPPGCHTAKYVDGMRELTQYNVMRDEFMVRYDWMHEGQQRTYLADAITSYNKDSGWFEQQLSSRRAAARKAKDAT